MLIVPCTLVFSVTKGFMTVEKKKMKNRVYSLINFKDCVLFPVLPKNACVKSNIEDYHNFSKYNWLVVG